MYRPVARKEISESVVQLRELHRQFEPANERERYTFERRELVTKNLLSNLRRMGDHPTLGMLLEIADIFSLTIEGAHRLFGYDLGGLREYDRRLNAGRTHIVDSSPRLVMSMYLLHRLPGQGSDPTGTPAEHSGTKQRTEEPWNSILETAAHHANSSEDEPSKTDDRASIDRERFEGSHKGLCPGEVHRALPMRDA